MQLKLFLFNLLPMQIANDKRDLIGNYARQLLEYSHIHCLGKFLTIKRSKEITVY